MIVVADKINGLYVQIDNLIELRYIVASVLLKLMLLLIAFLIVLEHIFHYFEFFMTLFA